MNNPQSYPPVLTTWTAENNAQAYIDRRAQLEAAEEQLKRARDAMDAAILRYDAAWEARFHAFTAYTNAFNAVAQAKKESMNGLL